MAALEVGREEQNPGAGSAPPPDEGSAAHRRSGGTAGDSPLELSDLADPAACDVHRAGGKAAALARATQAGLPTVPGVVVPVGAELGDLDARSPLAAAIRRRLGAGPLVARSSSPIEDTAGSSMAGRFTSVLDLRDDAALAEGITAVIASGEAVADGDGLTAVPSVAVLVQPMVDAVAGGVCFGVEPVTGRSDRRAVVVSSAGPDAVVSGAVAGVHHLLRPDGSLVVRRGDDDPGARLDRRQCRALAVLSDRCADLFGAPQDIEFAFDRDGRLVLLQSRPVTTAVRGAPEGPVYGTGPVAETFPDALTTLERDLWVDPLRDGLREALALAALASRSTLHERPVVVCVDGYAAVDLELIGAHQPDRTWWRRFDLAQWGRRARATWRVGRLRAALGVLSRDVIVEADHALAEVGPLGALRDPQLLGVLQRCHVALRALHGHEALMGLLVPAKGTGLTGVSVAVRALSSARAQHVPDAEIIQRSPVVLALAGPRLDRTELPADVGRPGPLSTSPTDEAAVLREALRLRARWVQELTARAVRELATRLAERGSLDDPREVVALTLEELVSLVDSTGDPPPDLAVRAREELARGAPRPPARFRFDRAGRPVALDVPAGGTGTWETGGSGTGAGGGVARGPVRLDPAHVEPGDVLVVRDLRPDLAPVLARSAAIVAETGSPLAHLAILAREASVPIVVGAIGATTQFREGTRIEVDGGTGAVREIEPVDEPAHESEEER